jgi:NhaP-type Na+/H+ or K+/H+ antiporter
VIRPAAVIASFAGSRLPRGERLFIAWFGVRGIGSLYYLAIAVGSGYLAGGDAKEIAWIAIAAVIASIVVHGITASPLSRRWLPPEALSPGIADRD